MRIAVITSSFPRFRGDGAGSFIYSLTKSLGQLGHDVVVLAPDDPQVVPDWQSDVDVRRIRFVWPRSWARFGHGDSLAGDVTMRWRAYPLAVLFTLFATVQLWRTLRRQDSNVIFAQWLVPGGFVGALVSRLAGIPLVTGAHGSDVYVAENGHVLKPVIRFTLGRTDHMIACSHDLAQRLRKLGVPSERLTVVPYGVDTDRFAKRLNHAVSEAISDSSDTHGVRTVMVMGRLVQKKGFDYFLRAIPHVLESFAATRFLVGGDGDLRSELEALAGSLGILEHVTFLGYVPWHEAPGQIERADVFVVPSVVDAGGNVDGLPNVLLEAMACGRAVIASDVAGISTVIINDETGILVPPGNERALADAICLLLADSARRERLGNAARAKCTRELNWTSVGRRVADILGTAPKAQA